MSLRVLGSDTLSFSLQIASQINTLAQADPKQAMPPESHLQGWRALPLPVIIASALPGELPQTNGCCEAHWARRALFQVNNSKQTHFTAFRLLRNELLSVIT